MKRKVLLMLACLAIVGSFFVVGQRAQAATNLIANSSMETANTAGTAPTKWLTDRWGTNTATFSYPTTGYNSSRSVKVVVSGRTSGDAKWYFTPVAVQPNTDYTFSDYYIGNVSTTLTAMSLDSAGKATYWDIATAPISADWKKVTATIHTPANAKTLSILHLLRKNGSLQTDQASLTLKDIVVPPPPPPPPPVDTNPVPNPSLETAVGTTPSNWIASSWGTNSPTYQYMNEGHTGTHSVKVTMGSYTSGDAKWYFEPLALTPAKDYKFSAWYKTNTVPHVVAMYIDSAGNEDFFGMPDPQPNATSSTTWQQYSDTFSVPSTAKMVSVFFFLDKPGWLQTDEYSIAPYQFVGFNRGLVSLTFDDGHEENITTVLPKLNSLGLKSTQFDATTFVEGDPAAEADVLAFKNAGHEIGSHTVTHPFLTTLNATNLSYELTHSRDYLAALIGAPVRNFASPYGDYNANVNNVIRTLYRSHRTVDEGYNSKDNFDVYRIRVQNMQATTTLAQYQEWVNKAKADKTWLVLVYHRVTSGTPEQFDTKLTDFNAQMSFITSSGITIKGYNDALDELMPQL